MLIQKIFHLPHSLEETRRRLHQLGGGSGAQEGAAWQEAAPERTHLELHSDTGFEADCEVELLPTRSPSQILFRSINSDIKFTGLLEMFSIRSQFTEIELTLDYAPESSTPVYTRTELEALLHAQLKQLQGRLHEPQLSAVHCN